MALATSVSVTLLRTLVGFMSISGICTAKVWQDCLLQHPFPMCYRPAKEVSCLQGGRRPFQPWASLLDFAICSWKGTDDRGRAASWAPAAPRVMENYAVCKAPAVAMFEITFPFSG